MVAFFQYLTEKELSEHDTYIFAVEEPENCLHPRLQRELINSFKKLSDAGSQIIITSHSPIFAGLSPIDDISLIKRQNGVASAQQVSDFPTSEGFVNNIAEDLGVEPSDQITGYNACIFVEGPTDIDFLRWIASKLKDEGVIQSNFEDKNIGFIILGGDNIKHWIDRRAMRRLNKRFGVMVDGDRKNSTQHIPQKKLNWKQKCEEEGGIFFILRKRDIENYIHHDTLIRAGCPEQEYDSFTDMKQIFGPNVYKYIHDMSANEILQMDLYNEGETQKHEIKEIIEKFLELSPI
jgi:predicted ATP-dependent endonuclease of OLD family